MPKRNDMMIGSDATTSALGQEPIVVGVGANPEPDDSVVVTYTESAPAARDPHRVDRLLPGNELEAKTRVRWISLPPAKGYPRRPFDLLRQRGKALPILFRRLGTHPAWGRLFCSTESHRLSAANSKLSQCFLGQATKLALGLPELRRPSAVVGQFLHHRHGDGVLLFRRQFRRLLEGLLQKRSHPMNDRHWPTSGQRQSGQIANA
jgi:hypothetical protein